jgi:AAA domain
VIKRIELINFMSHSHTVIDLAEGLNVLCGPNNCGKSAVVSALRLVCYNESSTHVVRHDAREAVIIIETGDGHIVRWSRKRNGSPRYEIDGQVFDRLGKGGVPDRVHEVLKLPLVATDSQEQEFDVHFGQQQAPIFLLNAPARASAFFFASSSDAIRLVEMQNLHRQNVIDKTRDRKRLGEEQTERIELVNRISSLDPVLQQLGTVEETFSALRDEAVATTGFADHIANTELLTKEIQVQGSRLEQLANLSQAPAAAETGPIENVIAAIETQSAVLGLSALIASASRVVAEPPALHSLEPIQQAIAGLASADQAASTSAQYVELLRTVYAPPADMETTELDSLIRNVASSEKSARQELKKARDASAASEVVLASIRDWIRNNPHCPTCGGLVTESELAGIVRHVHE